MFVAGDANFADTAVSTTGHDTAVGSTCHYLPDQSDRRVGQWQPDSGGFRSAQHNRRHRPCAGELLAHIRIAVSRRLYRGAMLGD
jgi:hypothetical protein